jgi:hypothetical protein
VKDWSGRLGFARVSRAPVVARKIEVDSLLGEPKTETQAAKHETKIAARARDLGWQDSVRARIFMAVTTGLRPAEQHLLDGNQTESQQH